MVKCTHSYRVVIQDSDNEATHSLYRQLNKGKWPSWDQGSYRKEENLYRHPYLSCCPLELEASVLPMSYTDPSVYCIHSQLIIVSHFLLCELSVWYSIPTSIQFNLIVLLNGNNGALLSSTKNYLSKTRFWTKKICLLSFSYLWFFLVSVFRHIPTSQK